MWVCSPLLRPKCLVQVDVAVTLLQDIWNTKIATSTPATYVKGVAADVPAKLEALKAVRLFFLRPSIC